MTKTPMHAPPSGPQTRTRREMRTDVQALRALAVVAVLGFHFAPSLLPGGYVGVDVFFVISGFVITTLMITEIRNTGRLSFSKFYARRARRILPAATVTIILTVLAGMLLWPLNLWESLGKDAFFTAVFAQNWHLASESVDYLAGGGNPSPMQHFWSLSIEEQFYFLWPAALVGAYLLVRAIRRRTADSPETDAGGEGLTTAALLVLIPTLVLTFWWSVSAVAQGDAAAYFTSHTRAWQLAVGAGLAVAWPAVNRFTGNSGAGLEPGTARLTWRTGILLLSGAGAVGYALLTFSGETPFPGIAALAPTLGTAALIAAGIPAARWVRSAPVQWLGNVSYSLYLVHWPIVIFLPKVFPEPVWAALGLGLSLVLAGWSYTYIEQGLPRLLARFNPETLNRRTLLAGGAAILTGVSVAAGAQGIFSHNVHSLEAEADELQQEEPDGFGADSIESSEYTALLPGTRGTAPSRATVRDDLPEGYADGCVGGNTDRDTPECSYGSEDADVTWVLVGDSHIDQYLPAFLQIVENRDIRLVTYFHANCPFNANQTEQDVAWGDPCKEANEQTMQRLEDMDADLVITSNWTEGEWAGDPVEGFEEAWENIPAPIVVIADNPAMKPGDGTTSCVVENYPDTETCAIPREEALPADYQLPAAEAAAGNEDVEVLNLTDAYCTEDECPPVIGNVMVYRDPHHITATYMRTLAPVLWEELSGIAASAAAG